MRVRRGAHAKAGGEWSGQEADVAAGESRKIRKILSSLRLGGWRAADLFDVLHRA
jgi:hypothetical protein